MSTPHFAKFDPYKLDSYNTYNYKYPERYDSCIWLRVLGVRRWDALVIDELMPGISSLDLLDVGCATGRLLAALGEAGAKNVNGLDLAPRILEVARENLASREIAADLRAADVEDRIPWPDDSFDVVTLTGVFHHLTRPRDALLEISRVVREEGHLLIVEPRFPFPLRQVFNLYLHIRPSEGDYRFYPSSAIVRILAELGWRRIRTRRAGWTGFMVCGLM